MFVAELEYSGKKTLAEHLISLLRPPTRNFENRVEIARIIARKSRGKSCQIAFLRFEGNRERQSETNNRLTDPSPGNRGGINPPSDLGRGNSEKLKGFIITILPKRAALAD